MLCLAEFLSNFRLNLFQQEKGTLTYSKKPSYICQSTNCNVSYALIVFKIVNTVLTIHLEL